MKSCLSQVVTICFAVALSMLVGCSNNSSVVSTSEWPVPPSSVSYWFPVQPGYQTTFEEKSNGGTIQTMTFQIGDSVTLDGRTARQWFVSNGAGVYDTNYFVATDNAIYAYDYPTAVAEQVLLMPLVPGASWKRFPQYDDTGRDTVSIVTGGLDPGDTLPPAGGGARKVIPTTGSNLMTVQRLEDIILRDGTSYTGTLRIANTNPNGTENRYWFAAGFGLVKYIIGASQSRPDGEKSGELVAWAK